MLSANVFSIVLLSLALIFITSEARFQIVSPNELIDSLKYSIILYHPFFTVLEEQIPYQLSRYGSVPYGSTLVGTLVLPTPADACDPIQAIPELYNQGSQVKVPIFIVERDGCQFSIKSKNAQTAGAMLLVIVDSKEEVMDQPFGAIQASDIHIPTIIIPHKDGTKLINYLKEAAEKNNEDKNFPVVAKMSFPLAPLSEKLNLDFWFSSADTSKTVYSFLKDFKYYYMKSNDSMTFQPHYVTWYCGACKVHDFTQPAPGCLSGDLKGPLTGINVVYEDLRQICLWRLNPSLWWDYIEEFGDKCMSHSDQEVCVKHIFDSIEVGQEMAEQINKCIHGSFVKQEGNTNQLDEDIEDNKILSEERILQEEYGVSVFPTLFVNHKAYHDKIDEGVKVFKDVCENLSVQSEACKQVRSRGTGSSLDSGTILITVGVMVLIGLLILYFYKRMQRKEMTKEMSMQISGMVAQYVELGYQKIGENPQNYSLI